MTPDDPRAAVMHQAKQWLADSIDAQVARAATGRLGPYWSLGDLASRMVRSGPDGMDFYLDGEPLISLRFVPAPALPEFDAAWWRMSLSVVDFTRRG